MKLEYKFCLELVSTLFFFCIFFVHGRYGEFWKAGKAACRPESGPKGPCMSAARGPSPGGAMAPGVKMDERLMPTMGGSIGFAAIRIFSNSASCSRLALARRFWNQILTCGHNENVSCVLISLLVYYEGENLSFIMIVMIMKISMIICYR